MNVGLQNRKVNFYGFAVQFQFIEVSLVYDRSDQHQTIYDRYDLELAARNIHSLTLENATSTYSITGVLEYNIDNEDDKHTLYSKLYSDALQRQRNNEIFQEITKEKDYFRSTSNEKLYIDMRRSKGYADELEKLTLGDSNVSLTVKLKAATTKKLRLKIIGYSQSEYFYTTSSQGQIMSFKRFNITRDNNIAA